jgi:aldose 1-epimerase
VIEREAPGVRLVLAPEHGGRIAQLTVHGHDLLVGPSHGEQHPMLWGSFPMVPWAGRVRHGRFRFGGRTYELPIDLPPHAIHGTTYLLPWAVEPDGTLATELGQAWPLGGHARQRFELTATQLTCSIEVHAGDRAMPAQAGWHPWFGRPCRLLFAANAMYALDDECIPTGQLTAVPPGPWDNCFTKLLGPPQLAFPGGPTLTVTSSCTDWVVYDRPEHAICVEPQTGPPDAFNHAPQVVEPGAPLVGTMTWRWA